MIRAMPEQRSVLSSAKLIAVCTLISRVTGLARDVLLAQAFGLSWVQDAFSYAFQFPNLFRRLFGEGAMAPVFVPTFSRTLETEGRQTAWQLLARTLALLTVTLAVVITVIGLALLVIWRCWPGEPEQMAARELLLSLTALMLPFMLTICVVALLSSILNCVGSFVPAALLPILMNVLMIAAIAWVGPTMFPGELRSQVYVVALSVVLAGVVQILVIIPVLRKHGVRMGWRLDVRDAHVQRMLRLLPPVALGQGVLAFGVFIDAQICALLTHVEGTPTTATMLGWTFAYPLQEGALSALTYAQRLYQFPLGVLVISLATAALPMFSRLAAREDWGAWSGQVRQALRLAVFEGVLAGVLMITLAEPMVRLLFEYGNFTAASTERTSVIVRIFGFGLWAFCAQHIVLRAFYSRHNVRTPLKITAGLLPLNIAISLVLVWVEGVREAAFAISSCVTSTLAVLLGLAILQRELRSRLLDGATSWALVRMVLAGAAAGVCVWLVHPLLAEAARSVPVVLIGRAVETFGGLLLGTGIYLLVAWVLRLDDVKLLLGRGTKTNSV